MKTKQFQINLVILHPDGIHQSSFTSIEPDEKTQVEFRNY